MECSFIVPAELSEDKPFRKESNDILRKLPDRLDHTAVVNAKGTTTIDSTHFDTRIQLLLGERYFTEMQKLMDQ